MLDEEDGYDTFVNMVEVYKCKRMEQHPKQFQLMSESQLLEKKLYVEYMYVYNTFTRKYANKLQTMSEIERYAFETRLMTMAKRLTEVKAEAEKAENTNTNRSVKRYYTSDTSDRLIYKVFPKSNEQ